jgi:hypothetical protein
MFSKIVVEYLATEGENSNFFSAKAAKALQSKKNNYIFSFFFEL